MGDTIKSSAYSFRPTKRLDVPSIGQVFCGPFAPLRLPKSSCPRCDNRNTSPEIVCNSKSQFEFVKQLLATVKPPSSVPWDSFGKIQEKIRDVLNLKVNTPILPNARCGPVSLDFRGFPIEKSVVWDGIDTNTIFFNMSHIKSAILINLGVIPISSDCGNPDIATSAFSELTVPKFATLLANDSQIANYLYETLGVEDCSSVYARCNLCDRLPVRKRLEGQDWILRSSSHIFQLADFSGLYASAYAKSILETYFPEVFEFTYACKIEFLTEALANNIIPIEFK